jgi:hypothetical protein
MTTPTASQLPGGNPPHVARCTDSGESEVGARKRIEP